MPTCKSNRQQRIALARMDRRIVRVPAHFADEDFGIDGIDYSRIHLRSRVFNIADPRHIGVVRAIDWSNATVQWEETGWISQNVPVCSLRLAWRIERA